MSMNLGEGLTAEDVQICFRKDMLNIMKKKFSEHRYIAEVMIIKSIILDC